MVMASQGQIFMQSVQPVHLSILTSQTIMPKGLLGSWSTFAMQSSQGATAIQASQPVQRSSQIFAMVLERRGAAFGATAGTDADGVGPCPLGMAPACRTGLSGVLSTMEVEIISIRLIDVKSFVLAGGRISRQKNI